MVLVGVKCESDRVSLHPSTFFPRRELRGVREAEVPWLSTRLTGNEEPIEEIRLVHAFLVIAETPLLITYLHY